MEIKLRDARFFAEARSGARLDLLMSLAEGLEREADETDRLRKPTALKRLERPSETPFPDVAIRNQSSFRGR
jgi:hypothetical protein